MSQEAERTQTATPAPEGEKKPWYRSAFWNDVTSRTVATLIAAAVIAALGVGYSQVKGMSLEDALLYIVLPFVLLALALGGFLGISRVARTFRDQRQRIDSLSERADKLMAYGFAVNVDLLQLHLRDLVADAENYGWTIVADVQGITFVSPDDDALPVGLHETDPREVAQKLHDLDPHHFPADWAAPSPNRVLAALIESDDAAALTELRETDAELRNLVMDQLRAAADRVEAIERQLQKINSLSSNDLTLALAILRSRGWVAEGMNGNTMYILRKEGMAPAYFDVASLDVGKLFDAVGKLEAEHRASSQR